MRAVIFIFLSHKFIYSVICLVYSIYLFNPFRTPCCTGSSSIINTVFQRARQHPKNVTVKSCRYNMHSTIVKKTKTFSFSEPAVGNRFQIVIGRGSSSTCACNVIYTTWSNVHNPNSTFRRHMWCTVLT